MSNSEMLSSLFHNKDCPFGYQCLANDCIECSELHHIEDLEVADEE